MSALFDLTGKVALVTGASQATCAKDKSRTTLPDDDAAENT